MPQGPDVLLLVVEDKPKTRDYLRRSLPEEGFVVDTRPTDSTAYPLS